jgi:hypothetical protein
VTVFDLQQMGVDKSLDIFSKTKVDFFQSDGISVSKNVFNIQKIGV